MRPYDDKYARLALQMTETLRKKVDRFALAPMLWALADYLESVDDGKHEQHLLMLAGKWING